LGEKLTFLPFCFFFAQKKTLFSVHTFSRLLKLTKTAMTPKPQLQ